MRIRDHPTALRSTWQIGHVERLIAIDSARKHRALHRVRRSEDASRAKELRVSLRQSPHASLIGKECARFLAPAEARHHRGHTNSRWRHHRYIRVEVLTKRIRFWGTTAIQITVEM